MPLLALPPFLTRRKEAAMPETTVEPDKTGPNVLMRFLTQGGAIVVVTGSGLYGLEDNHWKCLGCDDTDNVIGRYDWDARDKANDHATHCRAMPKPEA
ncbi:hypothetical protein SMD44_00944 [Streptomyces alboflavus]|uniref:Uncharacterized protein n=1 Tax=Streptomyces alboflavus TaxID=67267 RepID=A0A1Z1W543_9ACTN|nr:hypothetical protein [Streptomyces alboflavus]ARX81546.1 hypothetical protein SMD44_00944 [Streptomyces alboflavus]